MCAYGGRTYIKDAVGRVELIYGCVSKVSTPLPVMDCHPELDESPLLGLDNHRNFQMLLEISQLLVIICQPNLFHLVSSLSRFGSCDFKIKNISNKLEF